MNQKQSPECTPVARRGLARLLPVMTTAMLLAVPVLWSVPGVAQPPAGLSPIDNTTKAAIIDSVTTALNEVYIFADKAAEMDRHVRARLQDGAYREIESPVEFTNQLTQDLRSICQDRHLGVRAEPPQPPEESELSDEQQRARYLARARASNYQFEKLEILPGNIGYLKFDAFMGAEDAGATAVAALNFLAHVDALIIDLRENGGGNPSMIQLITSYFFAEPTHLNSFYIRKSDETKQFWTQAHVTGPRLTEVPIWVLTSQYTFSGAEEFTYNLKNLERATIVGETTGGGAHPVEGHYFDFGEFVVTMSLPYGRAVNPVTGTNWEGTGVEPHIQTPADQALVTAQLEALKTLAEQETDGEMGQLIAWARRGLEVQLNPVVLSESELTQYTGSFGPRRIWREDGVLWYQREDRPRYQLVPMGDDQFMLLDLDYFRLRFERGDDGKVARVVGLYDNGYQDMHEKTEG
jgi:hypothetical protein